MSDMQVTSTPKNKVIAATGGAAAGGAISTILLWCLNAAFTKFGLTIPNEVQAAFGTLFVTLVTLAAGYYTPPGANEGSVVDATGAVKSAVV